jgi:hypothetical protein
MYVRRRHTIYGDINDLTAKTVIPAKPGADIKRRRIDSHPEPQKVADFRDFRSAAVPMLHLRAPGFAVITKDTLTNTTKLSFQRLH